MAGTEEMERMFRERFQGHETPVDPGLWEGIAAQLPQPVPADDGQALRELFQERFQGHEAAVDPGTWAAIGSQLGHAATTVGTAGTGMFGGATGWVVGGAAAALLAGGIYLAVAPEAPAPAPPPAAVEQAPATTAEADEALPLAPALAALPAAEPAAAQAQPAARPAAPLPAENSPAAVQAAAPVPAAAPAEDAPAPATAQEPAHDRAADVLATTRSADTDAAPERMAVTMPQSATPGAMVVESIINDMAGQVTAQPELLRREPLPPASSVTNAEEDEPYHDPWPEEPPPPAEAITLFMPNVFTPDGDGVNDSYIIEGSGFDRITIKVFSAQNNRLVFSADHLKPWDGTDMNGVPCPDGYYVVAVEARGADGRVLPQSKAVWLNRNTAR